ncbi:MAG: translation elongation factor Ts [Elusimicrobia bacterium]|nr:translation elongation factor Ts [Candidatus Obscuribacterium magneticum]
MTSPTIQIKAEDVQKLRQLTGAGLMDCKNALTEARGDTEKAIRILREKGIAKSSKRAERVAAEGMVDTWVSPDQREAVILELNCETDFVARNSDFVNFSKTLLQTIKDHPQWTTADQVPKEPVAELSAKIGEKINLKRFTRFKAPEGGLIASYIHPGSKLAVLLQMESDKKGPASEELKGLGRELCIQVAGANPTYVDRHEVPPEVIEREKEISKKQMEGQKKPPEIMEKIAVNKLLQFYELHCLLDQPHVRDLAGKTRVQDLVEAVGKKETAKIKITKFVRYRVGADQ